MTERAFECPTCAIALGLGSSFTCRRCGLWWVRGELNERLAIARREGEPSSPSLSLELIEGLSPGCVTWLAALFIFGAGSAWTIWTARGAVPWADGWFGLLVSLPLGVLVAGLTGSMLAQAVLHRLRPSQLEGDATALRLRIWRTWGGLLSAFRRTDATIARRDIAGTAVGRAQGGQSQLFLVHSSGYHCYAGFAGDRERVNEQATAIQRWLVM